jgi:hypothetical protein
MDEARKLRRCIIVPPVNESIVGSVGPRFWGPQFAHRPKKKPRTPKPGVRATKSDGVEIIKIGIIPYFEKRGEEFSDFRLNRKTIPALGTTS